MASDRQVTHAPSIVFTYEVTHRIPVKHCNLTIFEQQVARKLKDAASEYLGTTEVRCVQVLSEVPDA